MGLIYYIPGRAAVDKAILAACGLEAIIEPDADSPGPSWRPMEPPGTPLDWPAGCLLGVRGADRAPPRLRYRANEQTWRDGGAYAVGMWNDDRPGPEELARPRQIYGHPVRLAGGDWTIPPIRLAACADGMANVDLDGEPVPAWLIDTFSAAFRRVYAQAFGRRLPLEVHTAAIAGLLAINYRLDPAGCDLLGLLADPQGCIAAVDAALDLPRVREMLSDPEARRLLAAVN